MKVFERAPTASQLLAQARESATLFLPHVEARWWGAALGIAGAVLGVASVRGIVDPQRWPGLALMMVAAGMVMHLVLKRSDTGWRVDFSQRRVEPVDRDGTAVALQGEGYAIVCTAGARRLSIAIDLVHDERGKLARIFQSVGPLTRADHGRYSELCDVLARRLQVARAGITI